VHAPWLTFEAGALSKTMEKSAVSPFLFDIKRSEVSGPILQFQSTIFEREDIKKLVASLNRACGTENLSEERLEKAFSVWYPTLEEQLNQLLESKALVSTGADVEKVIDSTSEILEEILDLTRNNQRLLRNPDGEFTREVEAIKGVLQKIQKRLELDDDMRGIRRSRRMHPSLIEELMHLTPRLDKNFYGFQFAISLFRNEFPWLYDAGIDLTRTLRSSAAQSEKEEALTAFYELLDVTFQHPIMREFYIPDKEIWMMGRELSHILKRSLERYPLERSTIAPMM
jgi:hypothetical protein